jgi:hypothetical protein
MRKGINNAMTIGNPRMRKETRVGTDVHLQHRPFERYECAAMSLLTDRCDAIRDRERSCKPDQLEA